MTGSVSAINQNPIAVGEKARWFLSPGAPLALLRELSDVHPVLVQILASRGLRTAAEQRRFLEREGVLPGEAERRFLPDLAVGCRRLLRAREAGEAVAVFADYDVDGVSSAAILRLGLERCGIFPRIRLPHRVRDGYGLGVSAVDELADLGVRVILTADCGTTSHAAVTRAHEREIDVIISDHHALASELPSAVAVINPQRLSESVEVAPDARRLCGAGIAFLFVQALADAALPEGSRGTRDLVDLAALGTVADVVPLLGWNRAIVRSGIAHWRRHPRPGLAALASIAKVRAEEITGDSIGYRIAPRLNAAGRLASPDSAFDLLVSEDSETTHALALHLDQLNAQRQELTRTYVAEALPVAQAAVASGAAGLVVGGTDWPRGIVGLIASEIASRFHRPTLVYSREGNHIHGSGRSIPAFDLHAGLVACGDCFLRFGGHRQAAGFTADASRLDELTSRFQAVAARCLTSEDLVPWLCATARLPFSRVDPDLGEALAKLEPFGASFERPLFIADDVEILDSRELNGQHWRVRVRQGTHVLSGIAFGHADWADQYPRGSRARIAFTLGSPDVANLPELIIVDVGWP